MVNKGGTQWLFHMHISEDKSVVCLTNCWTERCAWAQWTMCVYLYMCVAASVGICYF